MERSHSSSPLFTNNSHLTHNDDQMNATFPSPTVAVATDETETTQQQQQQVNQNQTSNCTETNSLPYTKSMPTFSHIINNNHLLMLPTSVVDLASRRSMSDSCVVQVRNSTITYDNKNMISMLFSRSGSSTIKKIILVIMDHCNQQTNQSAFEGIHNQLSDGASTTTGCDDNILSTKTGGDCFETDTVEDVRKQPPVEEIFILTQYAIDAYYKIIIRTNKGMQAIVQAMRCFPKDRRIQECCCLALSNMCFMGNNNNYGYGSMVASSNSNNNVNYQSRRNSAPTSFSETPSGPSALSSSMDQPSSSCPATLQAVQEVDGLYYILLAMKTYPTSVAVQSAACDALQNMSDLVLSCCCCTRRNSSNISSSTLGCNTTTPLCEMKDNNTVTVSPISTTEFIQQPVPLPTLNPTRDDLIQVLSHVKMMNLHPKYIMIADSLLSAITST